MLHVEQEAEGEEVLEEEGEAPAGRIGLPDLVRFPEGADWPVLWPQFEVLLERGALILLL